MKKIILLNSILFLGISFSFAQSSKVTSAYMLIDEFKTYKNPDDLVKAKEAIDKAIVHETTSLQGKTWYYKGIINHLLSQDSLLSLTDPNFAQTALESFEKAISLNDKKFRDKDSALEYIRAIGIDVFNSGVDALQNGNFEQAYKELYSMKDINATLEKNGIPITPGTETSNSISNAAYSAEMAGMKDEAIAAYKELLVLNPKVEYYNSLAKIYKGQGKKALAMSTLDDAAAKYPESAGIIIEQLNYFIEDDNLPAAMAKIDKAIELQPDNDMLYFVKGNAIEKSGDNEGAIIEYEKAIEINPNNMDALFNAGAMYFVGANKYIEEMNELSYNETKKYDELNAKRQEMYLKAKPYFEKILAIDPEDAATKKALYKINSALEN